MYLCCVLYCTKARYGEHFLPYIMAKIKAHNAAVAPATAAVVASPIAAEEAKAPAPTVAPVVVAA
jgi:hypothetical protein